MVASTRLPSTVDEHMQAALQSVMGASANASTWAAALVAPQPNIADLLKEHGEMAEGAAQFYTACLVLALQHLHSLGIACPAQTLPPPAPLSVSHIPHHAPALASLVSAWLREPTGRLTDPHPHPHPSPKP